MNEEQDQQLPDGTRSLVWVLDRASVIVIMNFAGYSVLYLPPRLSVNLTTGQVALMQAACVACLIAAIILCFGIRQCSPGAKWTAALSFLIHVSHC